jgi:hypothetical protein
MMVTMAMTMTEEQLVELIVQLIEPDTWQQRADVKCLAIPGGLIVRHTDAVHRQIGDLLMHLQIHSTVQANPAPAAAAFTGMRGGMGGGGMF